MINNTIYIISLFACPCQHKKINFARFRQIFHLTKRASFRPTRSLSAIGFPFILNRPAAAYDLPFSRSGRLVTLAVLPRSKPQTAKPQNPHSPTVSSTHSSKPKPSEYAQNPHNCPSRRSAQPSPFVRPNQT